MEYNKRRKKRTKKRGRKGRSNITEINLRVIDRLPWIARPSDINALSVVTGSHGWLACTACVALTSLSFVASARYLCARFFFAAKRGLREKKRQLRLKFRACRDTTKFWLLHSRFSFFLFPSMSIDLFASQAPTCSNKLLPQFLFTTLSSTLEWVRAMVRAYYNIGACDANKPNNEFWNMEHENRHRESIIV